ncbi:glycine--tRNA ligase [Candidatus Gottesmanbacteria bacterium]|nr:glycine--tRNA ligase [Candidatus Gottesmanbacteria bacterium]
MDKIVALTKRRGFVYPSSSIYGGFGGFWDFGPLGVELKNQIKKLWWDTFVRNRSDMYGLDSSIILNPKVWEASGHTGPGFADPLRECKKCHHRFREEDLKKDSCPDCGGDLMSPRSFNILVKTFIGSVEDTKATAYLRGETAQGIFINFKNIFDAFHPKLPFGIAQIGKAFRNEITPGNFFFRSREFEQMEIEYFVDPTLATSEFEKWVKQVFDWFILLGLKKENLRFFKHPQEKLAHYSKATTDIEYKFPFGWSEFQGTANRGDFDLMQHSKYSGKELMYQFQDGKKIFPYVIEPSFGVERLMLALLVDAYYEDTSNKRVVLKLSPKVSPYQVAVFPLLANKPELVDKAQVVFNNLRKKYRVIFDGRGNIGKRYFAQDEIGTPYCVTVDFDTLEDNSVTVRDRDTTKQDRVSITKLDEYLNNKLF